MLKVFMPEAAFPTDQNIVRLIKKLAGGNYERITGNPVLLEHYRHLLKGYNNMAMACHKKVTFTEKQLLSISGRSLFLFGEADPLGDAAYLRRCLEANRLDYRFFPGVGHLINHEIAQEINGIMVSYFIGDTPNGGIA